MKLPHLLTLACATLALSGCSGLGDSLGLGRNPPDEFAVVDRAPLSLPPDYELRPPQPGAPRPQEAHAKNEAAATVFGEEATATDEESTDRSPLEKALLATAGSPKADPAIRATLDREAAQKAKPEKSFVEDLMWWKNSTPPATTVDAEAEAARIRKAKEENTSPADGATPILDNQKPSLLPPENAQ